MPEPMTDEERAEKIRNLTRFANGYIDKAAAAWWPGAKKDYLRIAAAAYREIAKLEESR